MGDFSSPKRREVFDRLRRRYEFYRRHQNGTARRFENTINGLYEQQRQETILLQQRWLESRAKKASKQSKTNKDSSSGHGGESRNLIVTQRLKKKIDNSQVENPPTDTSAFDFDDSDTTATKKTVTNPQGVDVSINIVQQIRGGNSQQEQKIQTNVNVSTTVKHYTSSNTPETGSAQTSTNVETSTSVECKQEPGLDDTQCGGSNQSESSQNSSDILNQDELEAILNTIDSGNDEISDELYEELKKFDQIYSKVLQEDSNESQDKMYSGMTSTSPSMQKHAPSGPFPEQSPDNLNNVYDGNQNINPIRTPPMHPSYRTPPNPSGVTMSETGPAAETLKQMAAQHQSQQHEIGYGMKPVDPYGTPDVQGGPYRQNGYPANYDPHYMSQNAYLGQQAQNMNNMRNSQVQYGCNKSDMGLNYGATKPLTHYSAPQQTPSSLQQLQNQVQAHFSQGPQMEITQTQHMQVSEGPHRMQMSQTQQLQMRQPHQIAMSQQQSFSMGQSHSSQYMDEQMKMEMMEKMRQESLRKQQAAQQQQQQQQAADAQSQAARAAHMQQYMNRPPPEYKMQQPTGQATPDGYSANGVAANPLQTMQNMVNQTNSLPTSGYGQVKTESGTVQNGMMQSAQMSSMQRMSSSGQSQAGLARQTSATQSSSTNYPGQPITRQQSYPGAQQPPTQDVRQARPNGPTFTSAIMRNQRPPNVNVGPEGLNISQPRTQHDWPRQMVPSQGPRHQGVPGGMNQPQMSGTGMMQYSSYSNQCGNMNAVQASMQMRQTRPMQMSAMQSQAAMMQGNPQQQMMMQQNMQMSQRMNIRGPMPGNVSGNMAPPMDASGSGYSSPPGAPHPDDFMNLLDSAHGSNSEFIDGITVQSSDANNDATWLDEILGGK